MCCAFLVLVFLGPRFFGAIWWLARPYMWEAAFGSFLGGNLPYWVWAIAGIVFLPWTSIMFVILMSPTLIPTTGVVVPGTINGWDWLWLGLGVLADVAWYASPTRRKSLAYNGTSYQGY